MINKNGLPLLGFGCLRLQKNIEESEKQILYALEQGITYFDTAYIYPGNEVLLGKIFAANHCRDQVQIATKLPHYLVKKPQDLERYFQIQLSRLQTNYVDYYLFHMLPDKEVWNKLISLGVLDWIKEKKASGQIKKIGFSYHGNTKNFLDLLDAYPWEFCQVQYNYMDEFAQAGRQGVETAWKKGIPVIIMEPLRGGLLANHLLEKAISIMKAKDPTKSPAYWAFRWLFTQPSISCVLSGMNTMEMLTENLQIFNESSPPLPDEAEFYASLKAAINEKTPIGCTGCGYCLPCPFGVDIPGCFRCFNVSGQDGYFKGFKEYIMVTSFGRKNSNGGKCTGCGKCKKNCPQSIDIPVELKKVKGKFEHFIYKIAKAYIRRRL